MSELLKAAEHRKAVLKEMILKLHEGETAAEVRAQLVKVLGSIPYDDVVQVEQELIRDGMPPEEILRLCDIHSAALKGALDAPEEIDVPPGHPIHTFLMENRSLRWEIDSVRKILDRLKAMGEEEDASGEMADVRGRFHALMDVDKHYRRKENLLFPFLEKREIEGPPTVMWGKDDEIRKALREAAELLASMEKCTAAEASLAADGSLLPVLDSLEEMIYKEEKILLPLSLETLTPAEWAQIYDQSLSIGFCLYDPVDEWTPPREAMVESGESRDPEEVRFPSGSLTPEQIHAIFSTIPFDLTFVDTDDRVHYFTQGRERIFDRNRAILGRKVQFCHPPSSVDVVERILADFRSGKQDRAAFWITLGGQFIMIEYFALRDAENRYIGTLEVSQNLTEKRALTGERRLLSYDDTPA